MTEAEDNYLTPMNETVKRFIEEENDDLFNSNWFDPSKRGKWMMFYSTEVMDQKWQQALSLYHAKELTGIQSMKCSTAAPNPRAGNRKEGAIRFACGPYDDEALVLSYGKNLIARMKYTSNFGFIAYKTDEQSAIGTAATGAKKNYLYRLHVPTYSPNSDKSEQASESIVSATQSSSCSHINPEIIANFPYEAENFGMWVMVLNKAWVDASWKKACTLYDDLELPGVAYLKKRVNYFRSKTGAIMFFCKKPTSPDERNILKGYGKTLAKKMNYLAKDGSFHFKVFSGDSTSTTTLTISVLSPSVARV